MNGICDIYANAQSLAGEGTHVVSTDETTGIQALEHRYPDKLPSPGHPAAMDFEYIRHGTTSLIGFFNIASGSIYPPYLNETRNEADFWLQFSLDYPAKSKLCILHNFAREASAKSLAICAICCCEAARLNSNDFCEAVLVNLVAETCHFDGDLGEKGKAIRPLKS